MSISAAAQPHRLDFVVLGVARSGTTAMARTINLDPALFCGIEYFSGGGQLDYGALRMPDAFLGPDHRASSPRNTAESRRILREKLERGPVLAYGNKLPTYHLHLDAMNGQRPGLRNIWIYRSPRGFADSWDRRAANPRDDWPPGRLGLFGLCDWLILTSRLAEARYDARILDYTAMFFGDPDLVGEVLAYVGGRPPPVETLEAFRAKEFAGGGRTGEASGQAPAVEPSGYGTILDAIGTPGFEAAIAAQRFGPVGPLQPRMAAFAEAGLPRVLDHVAETLLASRSPDALAYAARWARSALMAFDNPASRSFALLRPGLVALIERLIPHLPEAALDDARRFAATLTRREGGDPAAGARLQALLPQPRPGGAAIGGASGRKDSAGAPAVQPRDPAARPAGATAAAAPAEDEEQAHLHHARALELKAAGDLAGAVEAARRAVALLPGQVRYQYMLGQLLLNADRAGEAAAAYARAIELGIKDHAVHGQHSRALLRLGDLDAALAAAERAATMAPQDPAVREWAERLRQRAARQGQERGGAARATSRPARRGRGGGD